MYRGFAIVFTILISAAIWITAAGPSGAVVTPHAASAVIEAAVAETRCGWFVNPTPANAWLIDAQGEWTIGTQGGDQAEGDWPTFSDARWVKTNGNYGHGCTCMRVTTNRAEQQILTIHSASSRPLSTCRKDKALKGKEPSGDE